MVQDDPITDSTEELYLLAVTLALLLLLGLGLNLTVIVAFIFSKTLRQTKHNVLILQLMVCDMIYALWVMPVTVTDVVCSESKCSATLRNGVVCQVTGFLSVFQCTLSSLTLATIAIDRYVAVLHPHAYVTVLTRPRTMVLLAFCSVWAGLTALPPLLPEQTASYIYERDTRHCSPSFRTTCWYFWYAIGMGYGIPLPTMAFCYFNVARTLRNHKRKVFAGNRVISINVSVAASNNDGRRGDTYFTDTSEEKSQKPVPVKKPNMNSADKQIARRGALLITAYFLCWGPYALIHACPVHVEVPNSVGVAAMYLVFTLTVINPIVYVFNNRQFRTELKKLCQRRRGHSDNDTFPCGTTRVARTRP